MDLEELLRALDIDSPAELVYFEQFADLMEDQRDIPFEALAALVEAMDQDVLAELVGGYFEEIEGAVPDGEDELFLLLDNIGTTLQSLAAGNEDDGIRIFAEELYRFRVWYLFESHVICKRLDDGAESEVSLFEALTNYRAQSLTEEDYSFDFAETLDYQLEEYVVSLSSIIEDNYGDGDSYGEEEDYCDPEEED